MAEVLAAVATFKTDLVGGTTVRYWTAGREYLGANRPGAFEPCIVGFANLQRDAFTDGTFGEAAVGGGELTLANPAGALDDLLTLGGGALELYLLAAEDADWNGKTTLALLEVAAISADVDDGTLTLRLKDRRALADVPFQTARYAGTNSGSTGREGLPADLKGKPKVDALGWVFQAPVPMVNTAGLVAQLDSIRINDIKDAKVFDGLVGLTRGANFTTIAALEASAPAAGTFTYYKGDNADGAFIKLAAVPKYALTADIEGQARGGTFRAKAADLWFEALTQRAGISSGNVSSADVTAVNTAVPEDMGLWIDSPVTVREVCNRIAASLPGFWGPDRLGVFRLFVLEDPSGKTPAAYFKPFLPTGTAKDTDGDIVAIERLAGEDETRGLPAAEITALYQEYSQVTDQGFDVNATAALREAGKNRWRKAVPTTALSNWRAKYALAPSLEFETLFATETGAKNFADRCKALFSVEGRARYRVTLRQSAAVVSAVDLGAYVNLTFPRFGLDAGKTGVVLGMRYRSFGEREVGEVVVCNVWM